MSWVVWNLSIVCMETMGVWKSSFGLESLDTWFRILYLVYGLGLGTPKLISGRVELRKVIRPYSCVLGEGWCN